MNLWLKVFSFSFLDVWKCFAIIYYHCLYKANNVRRLCGGENAL